MKKFDNIRVYAWVEFVIWLIIVAVSVLGFRYYKYQNQKQFKSYQIFMEDVDGLIVGSPVKFLGVQIGYVKKIQIVASSVYIKFVITQKGAYHDKIIVTKDPTRLGKVMSLFNDIFKEMDAIFGTLDHASNQFDLEHGIPANVVNPADATEQLIKVDSLIDSLHQTESKFMKNFKK